MIVNCITIRQPYASLIAAGIKKKEYRTWKVKTPCELYVHAGASDNIFDFDVGIDHDKYFSKKKHVPKFLDITEPEQDISLKAEYIGDENIQAQYALLKAEYAFERKESSVNPFPNNCILGKITIGHIEKEGPCYAWYISIVESIELITNVRGKLRIWKYKL